MDEQQQQFEAWAIRQKSTGYFLPTRWNKSRGFSHDEPTAGRFPRLLRSEHAAKVALRAWLKGKWQSYYETNDWDGRSDQVGAEPVAVEGRLADDMEIVRVVLIVDSCEVAK